MKLKVELLWRGGILADGESEDYREPEYEIVDADGGRQLVDRAFDTHEEVEAFIAATYPGCERWIPPPPSPKEAATLEKILAIVEAPPGGMTLDPRMVRNVMISHLYQNGYAAPVVARIRSALAIASAKCKNR